MSIAAAVTGAVAFIVTGAVMRHVLSPARHEPEIASEIVDATWVEERLGPEVVFEAPWPLESTSPDLPLELRALVKSSTWRSHEAHGLVIQAIAFTYRDGVPGDLDGAAQGAIANLRTVPGTLAVEPTTTETTVDGVRAIELAAIIRRDRGEPLRLRGLTLLIDHTLISFMLSAPADQVVAGRVWDRMRQTIRRARTP